MQAIRETTDWKFPNHIYLVDGLTLVAYIKKGTTEPFYFKKPYIGFKKNGRTFAPVNPNPFTVVKKAGVIEVSGSKGNVYWVDPEEKTCTCPGYVYRGKCKHLKEYADA